VVVTLVAGAYLAGVLGFLAWAAAKLTRPAHRAQADAALSGHGVEPTPLTRTLAVVVMALTWPWALYQDAVCPLRRRR